MCRKASQASSKGVSLDHAEGLSNCQVGPLCEENWKYISAGESLDPADQQTQEMCNMSLAVERREISATVHLYHAEPGKGSMSQTVGCNVLAA